jgi:uncharacterized protein (UPF0305 family)
MLLKYNLEAMTELKNKCLDDNENELINDEDVEMLNYSISNYMDKYAEGQDYQKRIIRIITTYLTFIVKKPLHPEGVFNIGGRALYKNGKVVCPIREREINKPGSLCRFCVSTS